MNNQNSSRKKRKRNRKSTEASGGLLDSVKQTVQPKLLEELRIKYQFVREPTLNVDDVTLGHGASTITRAKRFVASPDLRDPLKQKVGPTTEPQPNPKPSVSGPKLTPQEQLLNKYDNQRATKITKSKQKRKKRQPNLPQQHLKKPSLGGVSPRKFITSIVNEVKIPPWMSKEEFMSVYSWLYSNKTELMQKGVARVAAWSTRCHLPIGINVTAHLCEAFLMEMNHNAGNSYQALSFGYSVAITRFINGLAQAGFKGRGIASVTKQFDIPQWVVDLRHEASHRDLPSVSRLRTGATFCLRWLKLNYWKECREIQNSQRVESHLTNAYLGATCGPLLPLVPREEAESGEGVVAMGASEGGAVWKITHGLCNSKVELTDLLTSSTYEALAGHLLKKQLLQFPNNINSFVLKTPKETDLISFAELQVGSADLAMWKKHLLKACEQNACFKQNLISALIVVVNNNECEAGLRDYLCSWLCMLMVEQNLVAEEEDDEIEILHINDDNEEFLPGSLDWFSLLHVAKKHPGYYSYAIVNVILQHLKSTVAESTRENILYLTTLVTLSDRIGHSSYIPAVRRGTYEEEFKQAKEKVLHKRSKEWQSSLPPAKKAKLDKSTTKPRWSAVSDMTDWVKCPLGLAPEQTVSSPTMFDLPAHLDKATPSESTIISPMSLIARKEAEVEEDEREPNTYNSVVIGNIQNQVSLF